MECCGNCKYHKAVEKDTFVCQNEGSEGYALETAYDDCCEEFEEKRSSREYSRKD